MFMIYELLFFFFLMSLAIPSAIYSTVTRQIHITDTIFHTVRTYKTEPNQNISNITKLDFLGKVLQSSIQLH